MRVEVKSPCDTVGSYYFPNAFSPNNDGDNDYLKVYYENYDCIKNLKLLIFDRWGEKVFETNNKLFEWHGTYKNKTLNTQVLTYILQVDFSDGNNLTKRGNVSLIK